jgi:hypothetical protein
MTTNLLEELENSNVSPLDQLYSKEFIQGVMKAGSLISMLENKKVNNTLLLSLLLENSITWLVRGNLISEFKGPIKDSPPSCIYTLSMSLYNLLYKIPYCVGSIDPKLKAVMMVTSNTVTVVVMQQHLVLPSTLSKMASMIISR